MTHYEKVKADLCARPRSWLVTGCAGFIGSNLLEALLKLDQRVVGLDNFSTGKQDNLDEVQSLVSAERWQHFYFIEGDICDLETCRQAIKGMRYAAATPVREIDARDHNTAVDFVLHQAALGSVPRSIDDPICTNASNVTGFLNILVAARDARVKRLVYAASSSTYGDHPALPKVEDIIGNPLSPYAVTKYVNELYANVFARCYGIETVGLRYFNVFGPRQDPEGAYAAVIPKWIAAMLEGNPVCIHGDGETSRDFCYVDNALQANLLAATCGRPEAVNQVYNVAVGDRTTLNQLFELLASGLSQICRRPMLQAPTYQASRPGDVRHSQADVTKARKLIGYAPTHSIKEGLEEAMEWYVGNCKAPEAKGRLRTI